MIRAWARRIEAEHLAWNVATVAPYVPPGARVLDVGSWDCKLGAALRDRGARVTCVDVVDKNRTDVELRLMRGATLPVTGDERFDVVQFLYVLHHAADDLALLREARRVVADPAGQLRRALRRVRCLRAVQPFGRACGLPGSGCDRTRPPG